MAPPPKCAAGESPEADWPDLESDGKKRENVSLWKRARETLGSQNLSFLKDSPSPKGGASPTRPAPTKRREQVRNAQRTHRLRTQNYIKALETEVVRLRENDAKQRKQIIDNCECFKAFREFFDSHNYPLPQFFSEYIADLENGLDKAERRVVVSQIKDTLGNPRLRVTWQASEAPEHNVDQFGLDATVGRDVDFSAVDAFSSMPYIHSNPRVRSPLGTHEHSHDLPPQGKASPNPLGMIPGGGAGGSQSPIDNIQNAIEFVLALEHPCMQHTQYPNSIRESVEPGNHMMTASTALIARAPSDPKLNSNMTWEESTIVIKRLLSLSFVFQRPGELTPIQAWQFMVSHPEKAKLTQQGLESLILQLTSYVTCQGYGAVIPEDVFQQSFYQHLLAGRYGDEFLST